MLDMKVVFPRIKSTNTMHFSYILNIFKYCGANITYSDNLDIHCAAFKCIINGKTFIFDLSDFEEIDYEIDAPVLKRTLRKKIDNVYPLGPLMVRYSGGISMAEYKFLIAERKKELIPTRSYLYSQRVYGGAKKRRGDLSNFILNKKLNLSPIEYWEEAKTYKYNIFLPGANLYVLDRSPSELMFLGCTVMYPKIDIYFPDFIKLEPNIHYIKISDSGFNCLDNMNNETGKEAKEFFNCALPNNLLNWWTSI